MSVEFTFVPSALPDAASGRPGFFLDPAFTATLSRIEAAGFDTVVVDDPAGALINFDLAAAVAAATSTLRIALTHWAGDVSPPIAARQLATLDARADGRLALRMLADCAIDHRAAELTGSSHAASWRRTDEYVTLLKRLWSNDAPFDHEGPFYSIRGGFVGDSQRPLALRMAGMSGTALQVAGRHADIFELDALTPEEAAALIVRVRAAAEPYGRAHRIRFALPVRLSRSARRKPFDAVEASVVALLSFIEAGVSEVMVAETADIGAVERFGREIMPLLRNSARHLQARAAMHGCALRG